MALAACAFTACQGRLDIPQKGVVPMEEFYQTDEDAQSALTSAYYIAGRFFSNTMWTMTFSIHCPLKRRSKRQQKPPSNKNRLEASEQ